MNIKQLVCDLPCLIEVRGNADTEIASLSADSRRIKPGALFFCIRGIKVDAHEFGPQAVAAGAAALVVERVLDVDAAQIVVSDVRLAMNYIAQAFYGYPARSMRMVGITGTKGKSTTCFLIKSILQQAGYKVGLIGTIMTMIGDKRLPADLTTPDPIELQRLLREMADSGVDIVTMEVSAHALALNKLDGIVYDAAAFTNLSHDHLDFFGTPEKYFAAKQRLLTPEFTRCALLNGDDEHAASIVDGLKVPHERFAIREKANIYASDIEFDARGLSFSLHFHKRYALEIHLKLSGLFNVYNSLCAAAVCDALGVEGRFIKEGLEAIASVPGRMEVLDTIIKRGYSVRQTDEYIAKLLADKQQEKKKRLVIVNDLRIYLNSIKQVVNAIKDVGIPASMEQTVEGDEVVVSLRIKNQKKPKGGNSKPLF